MNSGGKLAELLARCYMRFCGYRILCKNYITGRGTTAGEVDFIAKRGKTIVFVEVKKRQTMEKAVYAISDNQQQRITRAAKNFLRKHQEYNGYNVRFDAIFIQFPYRLKHIKNAWIEE